jgi:hypothetical protein
MTILPSGSDISTQAKARNILFVLLGVVVLVLKRHYTGPAVEIVHAYAGNVAASFAVYFLFANLQFRPGIRKLLAAAAALAVVELFEAFDGFGVMMNTYDPIDFLANAVGIALAFLLDSTLSGKEGGHRPSPSP